MVNRKEIQKQIEKAQNKNKSLLPARLVEYKAKNRSLAQEKGVLAQFETADTLTKAKKVLYGK